MFLAFPKPSGLGADSQQRQLRRLDGPKGGQHSRDLSECSQIPEVSLETFQDLKEIQPDPITPLLLSGRG